MEQLTFPVVLDACCGSRMFWFDQKDPRALFIDKRQVVAEPVNGHPGGIVVAPDVLGDFMQMPFRDDSFYLVVFDPPHITERDGQGIIGTCYGYLPNDWRGAIQLGFKECFRVLRVHGVLIFKWSERLCPISEILPLAPQPPLFGTRNGKSTHWCVFMKS